MPIWMVDPTTGAAVTDPQKAAKALLLPMGGYKGAGLALMLGLARRHAQRRAVRPRLRRLQRRAGQASPIPGNSCWRSTRRASSRLRSSRPEVDRHIRELRTSKTLPGETVRLPGEERAKRRADRLANGLALPGELLTQLDKLAGELAIKPLAER